MNNNEVKESFIKIYEIVKRLRKECPWDRKQTFDSLRKLTIEETYELAEAITKKDYEGIKEESGDLLLHVLFYSILGEEINKFNIVDVIEFLSKKLISRHPHVFGDTVAKDAETVLKNWEKIKLKEKGKKSVLSGVPASLPAVVKALRLQEKASGIGFDWEKKEDVWKKVEEELNEVKLSAKKTDKEKLEGEIGDLLFSIINAARLYGIDAENALEKTNQKFIHRFNYIEDKAKEDGKTIADLNLKEMDKYWDEAKNKENQ
jgi:MazG family protein